MKQKNIFQCEKCSREFNKNYLLQRHLKRKIPCDIKYICNKCNKEFSTNQILTRHLNKKFPCKSLNDKEKLILLEKDIQIELYEKKLELYEKKLEVQLKYDKERMNLKKELSNVKVNGSNNIIINGININQPVYNINTFNMENITNHIEQNILSLGIDKFGNIISDGHDAKQNITKILELTYNNKDFPECKNLMYHSLSDKFFSMEKDHRWKETSYKEVKPIIINSLQKIIHPYMDDFKQHGKFIMNSREIMEADKNMAIHFKLSDCNTLIKNSDKCNKKKKRIIRSY